MVASLFGSVTVSGSSRPWSKVVAVTQPSGFVTVILVGSSAAAPAA